jgi:hypothetical protein
MDDASAARLQDLLRTELDWAAFLHLAALHGVMPLVYRHLITLGPAAVPPSTLDGLRDYCCANALHNRWLTEELLTLLQLLGRQGIAAIPYKGPVLAATVYGDPSLRQFADLDLLVRRGDVLHAKDLLLARGYRLPTPMTAAQERAYVRARCDYHLVRADGQIIVELHWGLTGPHFPFRLDLEEVWGRLQTAAFAGTTVRTLPPEDLLLMLCVHGAKHAWPQLKWICDVAELIRASPGLQWEGVLAQAHRLRSARLLWVGLQLASDLLGTTLPEPVWLRMQASPRIHAHAAQVRTRLFRDADGVLERVRRDVFPAKLLDRPQDRWRYRLHVLRRRLTPNVRDRAWLPLPPALTGLSYILRPLRLLREYGGRRPTSLR